MVKAKKKGKWTTKSKRAGLQFPIGRVAAKLRKGKYVSRISKTSPLYLTAVLEYLVTEILDLAGVEARKNKKTRITPRHLMFAIKSDPGLNKIFGNVAISESGVVPDIDPMLTKKK